MKIIQYMYIFNALVLTSLNKFPVCATKLKGYFITSVWLTNAPINVKPAGGEAGHRAGI